MHKVCDGAEVENDIADLKKTTRLILELHRAAGAHIEVGNHPLVVLQATGGTFLNPRGLFYEKDRMARHIGMGDGSHRRFFSRYGTES